MLSNPWAIGSLHGPPEQLCLGPDSRRAAWKGEAARLDATEALGKLSGSVSSKETGPGRRVSACVSN